MELIDKLKEIFNPNKQKAIGESNNYTIEQGLQDYLDNLLYLCDEKSGPALSYYALKMVNSHTDIPDRGKNHRREKKFIDKMMLKYRVTRYPRTFSKRASQYMIYGNKCNLDSFDENSKRIYINIKRKNIIKFAEKFVKYAKGQPFCIKISSDYGALKRQNNDPFMVYFKKEDEQIYYDIIEKISTKYPKLMEGAEKTNPFLQKGKLPGTSEGEQSKYFLFNLLNGKQMNINGSANNLVSYVLYDAFKTTLQEDLTNSEDINDLRFVDMVKIYKDIYCSEPAQKEEFFKKFVEKYKECANLNRLNTGYNQSVPTKEKLHERINTEPIFVNPDEIKHNGRIPDNNEKTH